MRYECNKCGKLCYAVAIGHDGILEFCPHERSEVHWNMVNDRRVVKYICCECEPECYLASEEHPCVCFIDNEKCKWSLM